MADKELLERANLNELDRTVIRGNSFDISKQIGKHDVSFIRANFIRKVVGRISSTNWNKITYEEAARLNDLMNELNIRI